MNLKRSLSLLGYGLLITLLGGCSVLSPIPELTPAEIPMASVTPLPTSTPTPNNSSQTPVETESTPVGLDETDDDPSSEPTEVASDPAGPLAPSEIFSLVSPSVAFVETDIGSGSGVLIADNYVLTNAHVVWPYQAVRLVFPDGSEFLDAPVVGWDLIADLAVIGPVDTDLEMFELSDGEGLDIGAETYLIGYPGELERFPQPTIGRGLISRQREWEIERITYFQTDANVAGGQSGGVMVSDIGKVIGITGFSFTEANYGLTASAKDIKARVDLLIQNSENGGSIDRLYPLDAGSREAAATLNNYWESDYFILNEPAGTEVRLTVESRAVDDMVLVLTNPFGEVVQLDSPESKGSSSEYRFETTYTGFHFVEIYSFSAGRVAYDLQSNRDFVELNDPDDQKVLSLDDRVLGHLDYPGDIDYFQIELEEGEEINIHIDSILIDPFLSIEHSEDIDIETVVDDDSGGGLFDLDAELTYRAIRDGVYYLLVSDSYFSNTGGYSLEISAPPYEEASLVPTPVVPELVEIESIGDSLEVIESEVGPLKLYDHIEFGFQMQFPADWSFITGDDEADFNDFCIEEFVTDCIAGEDGLLVITLEDLGTLGLGEIGIDGYADLIEGTITSFFDLQSREIYVTDEGEEGVLFVATFSDGLINVRRVVFVKGERAFGASYIFTGEIDEESLALIEYTFSQIVLE